MTEATKYPPADTTTQWRGGRPVMATVNKVLWHTTESYSWPSYPTFAPNLTYNPWLRKWRQHYPVNQASLTLKNALGGSYQTNRQNVCQVEIVAYCDPARSSSPAHISRISDAAYGDLAKFFHWLFVEWDVPLENYPRWKPYPESYGLDNGIRMTTSQFTAFKGACGHQHAPGNSHGDPGALKVGTILSKAKALETGDDMALSAEDVDRIATATVKKLFAAKVVSPPEGFGTEDQKWSVPGTLGFIAQKADSTLDAVETPPPSA